MRQTVISHEQELLRKVVSGDRQAFAELISMYKDYVFTICFSISQRSDIAEELTQDTFLKVHKNLSSFEGKSSFKTWIYQIAKNTSLSYLRKQKQEYPISDEVLNNSVHHAHYQPEHSKTEQELKLDRALGEMIPADRMVITLFYLEERRINEIASMMKLTENTIKVKLHRARKRLKKIIEEL